MTDSPEEPTSATAAFYLEQARDQIQLAENTSLPARFQIHSAAAARWMRMAELALRVERTRKQP